MPMNRIKTGLALGTFAAFGHLVWVILVALKWAQPLSSFVHHMHFLGNTMVFLPFNFGRAIVLIIIAFAMAFIGGFIFATIWNRFHRITPIY